MLSRNYAVSFEITGDARPTRILLYHRRLSTTLCR